MDSGKEIVCSDCERYDWCRKCEFSGICHLTNNFYFKKKDKKKKKKEKYL